MSRRTFDDVYANFIERSSGKAARTLAEMRDRLAELEAGATPRYSSDNAEAKRRMIARYCEGFRLAARCERCGKQLEDPISVARRVGPECWERLNRQPAVVAQPAMSEDTF